MSSEKKPRKGRGRGKGASGKKGAGKKGRTAARERSAGGVVVRGEEVY